MFVQHYTTGTDHHSQPSHHSARLDTPIPVDTSDIQTVTAHTPLYNNKMTLPRNINKQLSINTSNIHSYTPRHCDRTSNHYAFT